MMHGLATYDAVASATVTAANPVNTAVAAAGLPSGAVHVGNAPQGAALPFLVLGDDTEAPGALFVDKRGDVNDVTLTASAWAATLRKARQIAEAWGQAVVTNKPAPTGARVARARLDLSALIGRDPDPNAPPAFGWAIRLRYTLDPT